MTSSKRKNPARGASTADIEMKRARLDDRSSPSSLESTAELAVVADVGNASLSSSTPSAWDGSETGAETTLTDTSDDASANTAQDIRPLDDADDTTESVAPAVVVEDPAPAVVADDPAPATVVGDVDPVQALAGVAAPEEGAGLTDASSVHHPAFNGLLYVPYEDLQRATGFAQKDEPSTKRYALSKIPTDAAWGTTPATERFLCDKSGTPLTCWLLSTIHSKWFYNMNGDPQGRVNVGVKLPYIGDYDALRRLYGKARPKRETVPDVVYASRMMSRQPKGEDATIILPFNAIYDARERFRPKRDMPAISAQAIGKGDLVLVEALVSRWKTSKDKKNRKGWSLWDVGFELQAVSHLFDAPDGYEAEDGPVIVDDGDDM